MNPWLQLLLGLIAASLVMTVLWFVQRRTGNAGIVDAGWAASIGALAVAFASFGDGADLRRWIIGAMGGFWGFRLASHIHNRAHGKPEDGRYQELRRQWGAQVQWRMFRFYQIQAITVAFFAIPFVLAVTRAEPLGWLDILAITIGLTGMIGESVADAQLNAFKRKKTGGVCREGLWRFSRHPNYFFEWLNWIAFSLLATPAEWGWIAWLCPAAMLYLLLGVTGIPATEAQAVRSKGDAYREYQRTTSAFVPWFPKKGSS